VNLLILTCPRKSMADPWAYLRATVAQVEAEETSLNCGLVVDGSFAGGPTLPDGWTVHEFDRTAPGPYRTEIAGNKWPFWHLLSLGAQLGGDLIALEDDLLFCYQAVRRMMSLIIPRDVSWVQFFSPAVLPSPQSHPGLWRPPIGSSMFLQAARFTAPALAKLVAWRDDPRWVSYDASDTALAVASQCLGLRYGAHAPDLVQHVGGVSNMAPGEGLEGWRMSSCWGGQDFDAMSLHRRDDLYR
jgi:hypothetical protein